MSVIIGIDPGSLRSGWGVVSTHKSQVECLGSGVISVGEGFPLERRLAHLSRELKKILEEFSPQCMVVEKVFFGKNADSAFKLGHARGVCLAAAGLHGLDLAEYATRYVKKALTGNGAASKEQVQFLVQHILRVQTPQLDASDALAMALCHARVLEVDGLFKQQEKTL